MYSFTHTNIVFLFKHLPTEIVLFIHVCYQMKCFSSDSFSFFRNRFYQYSSIFHRCSTTFTFPLLKNITKHLLIMQHMVIPFSFTFKSPALYKYASASSKSSKFLILQFLVKCCKLHSVFKILSKSYMLDIFLISSVYYKC